MSFLFRFFSRLWFVVPVGAFAFLVWSNSVRLQHVVEVSGLAAGEPVVADVTSPTGYHGGRRWLIAPEHHNETYQRIMETQQMFARGEWRVHHTDYDNPPSGREVRGSSLYRWWLGLVAWCDHRVSGRSLALSVEHAALFADPLLHLLLGIAATLFVAWRFGGFPAALLAVGLVALFPLAGGFLPGVLDQQGLSLGWALGSVLLLYGGSADSSADPRRVRGSFLAAGIFGGVGLWVSAAEQVPVLVGLFFGSLLAAWVTHSERKTTEMFFPWRLWSLGGASASLLAYLIEYDPAWMALRLGTNHPLYALAWLGAGEILHWAWTRRGIFFVNSREVFVFLLGLAAMAAAPLAMKLGQDPSLLAGDALATRLTNLPNGAVAQSFSAWLLRQGLSGVIAATVLPLLLLGPVLWLLVRRKTGGVLRRTLAIALGPVLVALVMAGLQLRWWSMLDGMLLALLVVATGSVGSAANPRPARWWWSGFAAVVFLAGLSQLLPAGAAKNTPTPLEAEGLVERNLAHWLATHGDAGGVVILAPPFRTTGLCYHGGFRGVGTFDRENREGFVTAMRIAASTAPEEAEALIQRSGVTHIIIPSWDNYLDDYVGMGTDRPQDSLMAALHRWGLPAWLQPVPYQLREVPGFAGHSVVILKVVDEQDPALALSRQIEYFIEMEQPAYAKAAGVALQQLPMDLGSLVSLAQLELVKGDAAKFTGMFNTLLANLSAGYDRALPWDRRVNLAVVLAQGKRSDLAAVQVRRCLAELDEARLRSLTTGSLYRLQVLGKAFQMEITDPRLRELALSLLPPEIRQAL